VHIVQLQQSVNFPHRYPCQVYMILLLQGEGDRFLNSRSTYIHCYTSSSLY